MVKSVFRVNSMSPCPACCCFCDGVENISFETLSPSLHFNHYFLSQSLFKYFNSNYGRVYHFLMAYSNRTQYVGCGRAGNWQCECPTDKSAPQHWAKSKRKAKAQLNISIMFQIKCMGALIKTWSRIIKTNPQKNVSTTIMTNE